MTSYTTQKIANLLKVTPQTIRNVAKTLDIVPEKTSDTKSFIFNEEQYKQISKHLNRQPIEQKQESFNDNQYQLLSDVVKTLQEQLTEKDRQISTLGKVIESQQEQIASLIDTNRQLSATNAVQVVSDKREVLLAESNQKQKEEEEDKGFWKRLFS